MQILKFKSDDDKIYYGCDYDGERACLLEGDVFKDAKKIGVRKRVKKILPPVEPAAIICIGLNYKAHAKETGMDLPRYPVVFMKNPGAVTGQGDPVVIPGSCAKVPEVDYEAELAAVIKTPVRNATPETALASVLGYTCANDISARRWQKHAGGGQWVKGKSFDTFCPLGPWMVTPDEIPDPGTLDISCLLNGKTMQESNTGDMIFSVGQIISFLSDSVTLLPGTVILTGTPSGVGFTRKPPVYLKDGDVLQTKIAGIGTLENRVRAQDQRL